MFVQLTMARPANEATFNDDGEAVNSTTPVMVNLAFLRSFNPRKHGEPGTRLTFDNGTGYAVTESFESVARLAGMAGAVFAAPCEAPRLAGPAD